MYQIAAPNAHRTIFQIVDKLKKYGYSTTGETGPKVRVLPMPVSILYQKPNERAVFWNGTGSPLFFFIQGLKLLQSCSGHVLQHAKQFKNEPFPSNVFNVLDEAPNTKIYIQKGDKNELNMMIQCPEIQGPPRHVESSMLHELLAKFLGCSLGSCWLTTMCLWSNIKTLEEMTPIDQEPYRTQVKGFPMIAIPINRWRRELDTFLKGGDELVDPFLTSVAGPIFRAQKLLEQHEFDEARSVVSGCQSTDWKRACQLYILKEGRSNMNNTDKIHALREAGNIRRFHTWTIHGANTVGQHSFNAANLLLVLHPNPSLELIKAALWHDAPSELWTGDTPAPAKWHGNGLKEKLKEIELICDAAYETAVPLNEDDAKWLWAVDKIDLWLWVIEQELLGNKTVKLIHDRLDIAFSIPGKLPPECVEFVKNYKWKKVNVAELPE